MAAVVVATHGISFPAGSLFSLEISDKQHINNSTTAVSVPSGTSLSIRTATSFTTQKEDTILSVASDANPQYLPLLSFVGDDISRFRHTATLLDVDGPTELRFKVESGSVNLFGRVISSSAGLVESPAKLINDAALRDKDQIVTMSVASPSSEHDSRIETDVQYQKCAKPKFKGTPALSVAATLPAINCQSMDEILGSGSTVKEKSALKPLTSEASVTITKNTVTETTDTTIMENQSEKIDDRKQLSSKKKKRKRDSEALKQTVAATVLSERRLPNGVVVKDTLLGTGPSLRPGRMASILYEGTLQSTGVVFDKKLKQQKPFTFRAGTGQVIRGLDVGLEGMRQGGERMVVVPPKLGYGGKGVGNGTIPGNATLVFEVRLVGVGAGAN